MYGIAKLTSIPIKLGTNANRGILKSQSEINPK
jgi:hypothetical protein